MSAIDLKVGAQCALALRDGTVFARMKVKNIVDQSHVIASLEIEHTPAALEAIEVLKELAQACSDFAFGVMAAAEGELGRLGVRLLVDSDSYGLPVGFSGLVIVDDLQQISFKVNDPRLTTGR